MRSAVQAEQPHRLFPPMLQDQPHGVGVGDAQFQCPLHMDALRQSVCVGDERTMEQDPTFVFRILVDIASKGLSPAINDPTTAVLAIDQVHHLLRSVGNRHLDEGRVHDS